MSRLILLLFVGLLLALPGSGKAEDAVPDTLVTFAMEDQFKRVHRNSDFQDQLIILMGTDRHASDFTETWGESLGVHIEAELDSGAVAFLPVADLRGVPFFAKGVVRGKFPKELHRWALVDWKGFWGKTYGFTKRRCNILIFNREHRLVFQTHLGEYDPDLLNTMLGRIRELARSKL